MQEHQQFISKFTAPFLCILFCCLTASAQNYERYKPLDIAAPGRPTPGLPEPAKLPAANQADRVLVERLDAIIIVDQSSKVTKSVDIDSLEGIEYKFEEPDSLMFKSQIRSILDLAIGQPITLRSVNELTRDIIKQYRKCKQPIVDVLIPEQRITGGTLQLVVTETRIGTVKVRPGQYFDFNSIAPWVQCTRSGNRLYEPHIERDLFFMNQNAFRNVSVDFKKGTQPGTTDVIYQVKDIAPIRAYTGIDDSGVSSLNYGRFFAGLQYGNFLGKGGTLGYQYTTDEEFSLLEAHSVSFNQPIDRFLSLQTFGSWSGVTPNLGTGLSQDGESYQIGGNWIRHLIRNRRQRQNLTLGFDFKSTNNNLEFDGTSISDSNADLFQLRLGFDDYRQIDLDQYRLFRADAFVGPGGGLTSANSTTAFATIRPGTSPDYVYGRMRYERADVFPNRWMAVCRATAQAASERVLFSETLGLGGFDTLRGFDQRAYNADHGWIANIEVGPVTRRWGCKHKRQSLRTYGFADLGNGYIQSPQTGEDSQVFAMSAGLGARYQLGDRLTARFDYGAAIEEISDLERSNRAHFGVTWIPGKRLY